MAKEQKRVELEKVEQHDAEMLEALRLSAGAGTENIKAGLDTQIPFISIIQSGSPQLKKSDSKRIEGAEEGDLFNTVTNKIYKVSEPDGKPLIVVPVGFNHFWIEWKLREKGGGMVGIHNNEMILSRTHKGGKNDKQDIVNDRPDNHIVSTATHSVIVLDPENGNYPAVISMTSTQLKKSRKWNTQTTMEKVNLGGQTFDAPMFYRRWAISTGPEKYAEGTSYGWIISALEVNSKEVFMEARNMYVKLRDTVSLPAPSDNDDIPDDNTRSSVDGGKAF